MIPRDPLWIRSVVARAANLPHHVRPRPGAIEQAARLLRFSEDTRGEGFAVSVEAGGDRGLCVEVSGRSRRFYFSCEGVPYVEFGQRDEALNVSGVFLIGTNSDLIGVVRNAFGWVKGEPAWADTYGGMSPRRAAAIAHAEFFG